MESSQPEHMDSIFTLLPSEEALKKSAPVRWAGRVLEKLLGLHQCSAIYRRVAHHRQPGPCMGAVLRDLQVTPRFAPEEAARIPRKGGCVVIANHPFGGLDGIILVELLLAIRPDVKMMANGLLAKIPQLRPITLPVDPFGSADARKANLGPLRAAMRWVNNGGMLLIFPAGEVSHWTLRRREIADPPWHPITARIIRRTAATVVPVFFSGHNSLLFQAVGLLHPRLRTLLLARELLRRRNRTVHLKIGNPIAPRWLKNYADDDRMLAYLRWRTHVMEHARIPRRTPSNRAGTVRTQPLAPPQPQKALQENVAQLPAHQCLARSGAFTVWHAQAQQLPHLLPEIGRLRESAFRLAGEGTGRPCDLDRFDNHYLHLFIWDAARCCIAGAYRIGQADRILVEKGRKGLYTNTLFHSRSAFYEQLGPALEMGRSFVHPEYQKSYAPLLLLWQGIGAFVARNPCYRMLFGPVSISADYSDLSRRLMATTLLRQKPAAELSLLVRPRKPARLGPMHVRGCGRTGGDAFFQDIKEVNAVVADIEMHQKEVPVLLRQYLNLGGRLLAFNLDNHFNGVLDGLIVVDLLQTDRKTLTRYMGVDGLATFLSHHGAGAAALDAYQQVG